MRPAPLRATAATGTATASPVPSSSPDHDPADGVGRSWNPETPNTLQASPRRTGPCPTPTVRKTHRKTPRSNSTLWPVRPLEKAFEFDKKKAPHWVVITGADSLCFYLHDPDADTHNKMEFQHIPIAKEDFLRLATYGSKKISALVIIDAKPF